MKYFIETYGCQMNFAESAAVELLLKSRKWTAAKSVNECDLLIINTCSVRITAETRVFGRLGLFSAMKTKRHFALLLMGCLAERIHEEIKKDFPRLDYVVGMFERQTFSAIFEEIEKTAVLSSKQFLPITSTAIPAPYKPAASYTKSQYHFSTCSHVEGSFQSSVPIMNGCNNFCTYCIVPFVRGREISRPTNEILQEVRMLSEKKVREITLLGQNVNSYHGLDPKTQEPINFPTLLRHVAAACANKDSIKWIRFISSHPKDLSDELIDTIAEEKRICKSIHLPVQHGANSMLNRMNRRYTREHYLLLVEKLKSKVKNVVLTTDILIGFPGETEKEFQETLSLMKEIQFDSAFMYHYNPREGTKAYDFEDRIPDTVKLKRLQQIIDLQMKITETRMQSRLGQQTDMLIESHSRNNPDELFGHTEQGEMVVLAEKRDSKYIGQIVPVELQSLKGKTFRALPMFPR